MILATNNYRTRKIRPGPNSVCSAGKTSRAIFRLLKTAAEMADAVEHGGKGGTVLTDDDGLPRDVFPLEIISAGPGDKYLPDLNEAVATYAREREIGLEKKSLKKNRPKLRTGYPVSPQVYLWNSIRLKI